jgi:outer membrane protein OmpA-like peptidoglycan-associated protein
MQQKRRNTRPYLVAAALPALLALGACGPDVYRARYAPLKIEVAVKAQPVVKKTIAISDRVQFRSNSARLLRRSHDVLDEVVDVLKKNPTLHIEIQGHTDDRGSTRHNEKLSTARAKAVRRYLMRKGIDGDRLSIKGYGPHQPLADNTTTRGRTQNRRVEFQIREERSDG